MRHLTSCSTPRRSGIVLLVVMAMLALFASVALSFVFYTDNEATASKFGREAHNRSQADVEAEVLASYFLNQFLYDTDNIGSAMRGWSLARTMYGYNPAGLNYTPYNGLPRSVLQFNDPALGLNHFSAINYQWIHDPANPGDATSNFARLPEYFGRGAGITPNGATQSGNIVTITTAQAHGFVVNQPVRIAGVSNAGYNGVFAVANVTSPTSFTYVNPLAGLPASGYGAAGDAATFRYVGGANPPWTAYDTNNLFLGMMSADGTVMLPSFSRPWTMAGTVGMPSERYASLRAWDMNTRTPDSEPIVFNTVNGPIPLTLDVRNNDSGPGFGVPGSITANNDSFWMDLGFPVMTGPNGRRFKPLFAPLVVDLSNRLHLWAHGNLLASNAPWQHASNQGIGAPEVNLGRALFSSADPQYAQKLAELQSLFNLKYGGATAAGTPIPIGAAGLFHSRYDFNAVDPGLNTGSNPPQLGFSTATAMATPPGAGQVMAVNQTMGVTSGGFPWAIRPGMFLGIDNGNSFEVVQVQSVNHTAVPPSFVADFTKGHGMNSPVSFSGALPFPVFPGGWDNGNAAELTNSPLALNLVAPTAPNRRPLPISHLEALLRFRGTNAPGSNSELYRRMPLIFSNPRARQMVTPWNVHLDRVVNSPFLTFDRTTAGHYLYDAKVGYPKIAPTSVTPPDPMNPASVSATNSEFNAEWRSNLGTLLRVNLNRPLTDYPAQNASGVIDVGNAAVLAQYNAATRDRQALALDIYRALMRVTGAQDPNTATPAPAANSGEYLAGRWLAQFAVNIVDYIDSDDYNTPFLWNTTGAGEYVFGTELPRLVLNEVYGQFDNDSKDDDSNGKGKGKAKANWYNVNFWAELHNPFRAASGDPYPRDANIARLVINGTPVYQLQVCKAQGLNAVLRDPANILGDPNFGGGPSPVLTTVTDWGSTATTQNVLPANGSGASPSVAPNNNQGFYVVGPQVTFVRAPLDPGLPMTHSTTQLSVEIKPANTQLFAVSVLLRRLANPHLPPQTNPNQALYNPYITVDYIDDIRPGNGIFDTRDFDDQGKNAGGTTPNQVWTMGRKHPYTAYHHPTNPGQSQIVAQSPNGTGMQPRNTFFALNTPNDVPFTWLTHLDRPLINQLELLHVSGFKQHELTQQFAVNNSYFSHIQHWRDPAGAHLLHRALELLGTPNNMAGTMSGGRWHGNVNLNTIMEEEIFQALCDSQDYSNSPQGKSWFTQADVQLIYRRLILARTPAFGPDPRVPIGEPRPFRSFGAGNKDDTWFRSDSAGPIFAPQSLNGTNAHPYAQVAPLQKIFNNITTTSNVFAVWWTVGYFEVVDESVKPARLGQELGRAENKHIRHRFFAIVDRSGMKLYNAAAQTAVTANALPQPMTLNPAAAATLNGAAAAWAGTRSYAIGDVVVYNGVGFYCIQPHTNMLPTVATYWQPILQPGMLLEIDAGTANAEVVAVQAVTNNDFTAVFTRSHAAGAPIIARGNPGPRSNFNPKNDTEVVLHLSVIQ